jgi:hypothetical protein
LPIAKAIWASAFFAGNWRCPREVRVGVDVGCRAAASSLLHLLLPTLPKSFAAASLACRDRWLQ